MIEFTVSIGQISYQFIKPDFSPRYTPIIDANLLVTGRLESRLAMFDNFNASIFEADISASDQKT